MDETVAVVLAILTVVIVLLVLAYRKGDKNLFSRMFGLPKEATTGERKFILTIYVLHRIWATAVVEFIVFVAFRMLAPDRFSTDDLLSILKEVNYVFLLGTGGAVAIYTGGNIGEWKYRVQSTEKTQQSGQSGM